VSHYRATCRVEVDLPSEWVAAESPQEAAAKLERGVGDYVRERLGPDARVVDVKAGVLVRHETDEPKRKSTASAATEE